MSVSQRDYATLIVIRSTEVDPLKPYSLYLATFVALLEEKRKVPYGAKFGATGGGPMAMSFPGAAASAAAAAAAAAASSKALYTPTGTDMDESSNDGDDMQRSQSRASNDMIIESTNGVPEQMIPLPDGPQPMVPPNPDIPPPLGIPLPPQAPGSLPPPPNLINPFGLPPS